MNTVRTGNIMALAVIAGLFAATRAIATTSTADSNITTVDTRGVATGTVTGTVLSNGSPLASAAVRVETTVFAANTLSDGTFMLINVPAGSGYVVDFSAPGYGSKRLTSVNVAAGSNDLGNITLAGASGPYRLIWMVPDVNPSTTTVEDGGTAYRYYRVLDASGNPQGGVTVSAQIAGGAAIPQAGNVSGYWPGQTAGISDADGIVRISVPASALGSAGAAQTVQCGLSGSVQQQFQAQVVPRQYDQVWKQKLGYGGSAGSGVLDVGANVSPESIICHTIVGGTPTAESISRVNTTGIQIGPSAGVDVGLSLKTTSLSFSAQDGVSASGQLSGAVVARSTYSFDDPNSTDPGQNAMKLYLVLGNIIFSTPGPQQAFYTFVKQTIEPSFLGSNLSSVEGEVQVGAGVQGQVGFVVTGGSQFQFGTAASGSADAEAITGFEKTFGATSESAGIIGTSESGAATVNFGMSAFDAGNAIGLSDLEMLIKSWTKQGQGSPYRSEKIQKLSLDAGEPMMLPAWQPYDPQALYSSYQRDFKETQEQSSGSSLVTYEWSVCAAQQTFGLNLGLNLMAFGVNLQGELDQGAEAANQRGAILQSRYWPTESYPAITASLFPSQSWISVLKQWGYNATGPLGQAVNEMITEVNNAGNTVVHAGQNAYNATLNVWNGAMTGGAQIYSSFSSWASGGVGGLIRVRPLDGGSGSASAYLPPDGTSNYVYGIDGIYRFASTNALNGTATLTIAYNPADVAGLNTTNLQIYQLPDGTNRWQLVGGVVDIVSNTVTATITNLGTYAIAPPLPTGDLQLVPSMSALPADGVSQMTVTVSNLMLNTGDVATQQWLFTATATGAQILNPDCDPNLPGIQVVSSNAAVTLLLQAPSGGTVVQVGLASVAGDAFGSVAVNLFDTNPPATPANVVVTAGQSRIWVTWATNSEPDLAGYRVYYRAGQNGPPYDGTAAVEGSPSPVQIAETNYCLLRGLSLGTNYFVAVSAVDTTGNESPLSAAQQITTMQVSPAPPTDVAVRFGSDGTNVIMWALSEDDGYNDRDVTNYYIWRAILPGGTYVKVGQVAAGIGVYTETNPAVASTQSVSYAVSVIDSSGLSSTQIVATVVVPASGVVSNNLVIGPCQMLPDGRFRLSVAGGASGQGYVLLASTNLVNWVPAWVFLSTNSPMMLYDPFASNFQQRFYKIGPLTSVPPMSLGVVAPGTFPSNGLDLILYSLPGLNYRIQVSIDLLNWQPLTNFVVTNSPAYFSDPAAMNYSRRFYRAIIP